MKYFFLILFMCSNFLTAQNIPLYVGTYTNGDSEGIYRYNFNTKTGKLQHKLLVAKTNNPSFLTISSDRKYLYAVSEMGNEEGAVEAYKIENETALKFINSVSSNGDHPCHVQLNGDASIVAVSNYSGGTISLHKIDDSGSINDAFQVIDHNSKTQKSHAHSAQFFESNLFVADLGRDFLAQYNINKQKFTLKKNYEMAPKAGPRHFEINKKGNFIYVINELNSTITVLEKGSEIYNNIQTISTLNEDFKGESFCADIHLSKDERFLYGSNRGENSIVVFKRNKKNGKLQKIQSISVKGDWPRNFTLSPKGKFLLVANQKSNNISVFKVDKKTGKLTFLHSETTAIPVCLVF